MTIGVYHHFLLIAECSTALEAWDKAEQWRSVLSPVEVRKVEQIQSEEGQYRQHSVR